MTTAQLEHLRLIDTHLKHLLEIASKRAPGVWEEGNGAVWHSCNSESQNEVCELVSPLNAAFIVATTGNAEAGWKATRTAIAVLLKIIEGKEPVEHGYSSALDGPYTSMFQTDAAIAAEKALLDIIAAFPLEYLKP